MWQTQKQHCCTKYVSVLTGLQEHTDSLAVDVLCGWSWLVNWRRSVVLSRFSTTPPLSNCPLFQAPWLPISKLDGTLSRWKTFHVVERVRAHNPWKFIDAPWVGIDRATKFSRGRGLNFAGPVKHISWFSYLKKNKSAVDCTYIVMVDVILKLCFFSFSQCKAKYFFRNVK